MDLQKRPRTSLTIVLALTLVASAAQAEKTLWLVRPLYPGQETLVDRTEKALDKLTPADARQDAVIGVKELAAALKGKSVGELPCFSADQRCADPIDPFVAGLGFERIVLVQGGQDEAGFKYRVVSYDPKTGKTNPATATSANLEKALLGAVAKVVPVASTLDVKSTPAGATVFIDEVKVGVTPLNTQVLPGERVIRLDLKLHQPVEETIVVPIRGQAVVDRPLDKVAARIVISALPAGTEISIDGAVVGKDKVDRGIAPGDHVIRLTAENYKAFEQTISVKPDQQFALDKTLEPVPGSPADKPKDPALPADKQVVVIRDPGTGAAVVTPAQPPPPPRPLTPEEQVYESRSYFHVTFEMANLLGNSFPARRFGAGGLGRTTTLDSASRTLIGASIEYGVFGKYFGVTVFGLSYLTNVDPWDMSVGFGPGTSREMFNGAEGPRQITQARTHLAVVRALQPQFRIALWRFQLGLQAGFEFRGGVVTGVSSPEYQDGFVPLALLASGRLNVRFYIVSGLFLQLQGNFSGHIIGEESTDDITGTTFRGPHSWGVNGGIGYGF
jgi:hypothetical protein